MIETTDAIVLRWYPLTNTSRMVIWYTRDYGRVTTVIKGCQRPKNPFLGQFDLFYTCELLFYSREKNDVHHCREVSPLHLRNNLRHDWRACAAASCFADMVWRCCPPRAPHPEIFELLENSLDWLNEHGTFSTFIFWFELHLLQDLGQSPQLNHCVNCHKEATSDRQPVHFSIERGGIICTACKQTHGPLKSILVSPRVRSVLRKLKASPTPEKISLDVGDIREAGKLMGQFMEYHLEANFDAQRYALGVMLKNTPVSSSTG